MQFINLGYKFNLLHYEEVIKSSTNIPSGNMGDTEVGTSKVILIQNIQYARQKTEVLIDSGKRYSLSRITKWILEYSVFEHKLLSSLLWSLYLTNGIVCHALCVTCQMCQPQLSEQIKVGNPYFILYL